MTEKRILIIGGGIAGLAAGCYARMNGFAAEVFESHSLPGGLCTGWDRQGFHIDGCLHWLVGSSPQNSFNTYLRELGAVQGRVFHNPVSFMRCTDLSGQTLTWYCDADKLGAELLRVSPADKKPIKTLVRLIKAFSTMGMPSHKAFALMNRREVLGVILKMLPYGRAYGQAMAVTVGEFAQQFKSALIRDSLVTALGDNRYPLMAVATTLGCLHAGDGGFPLGGSLAMAKAIVQRFADLGGILRLNASVEKILTNGGKAVGLRLANGTEYQGDYIVATSDLQAVMEILLGGEFPSAPHTAVLSDQVPKLSSSIQVSFGLKRIPSMTGLDSTEESTITHHHQLAEPFTFVGGTMTELITKDYGFDPALAPGGHRVMACWIPGVNFTAWEKLGQDKAAYKAEKARIAEYCIDQLEKLYPGARGAIVVTDVATPTTYKRYAGVSEGRYMTYIMTKENATQLRSLPQTIAGLQNLYLAGMWLMAPGGVPSAARSARDALQFICHQEKRGFITSEPSN